MFLYPQRKIGKSNVKIDVLGLGCAPLGGNFVDLTYNQAAEIIGFALDSGIKYFDTLLGTALAGQNVLLAIN